MILNCSEHLAGAFKSFTIEKWFRIIPKLTKRKATSMLLDSEVDLFFLDYFLFESFDFSRVMLCYLVC